MSQPLNSSWTTVVVDDPVDRIRFSPDRWQPLLYSMSDDSTYYQKTSTAKRNSGADDFNFTFTGSSVKVHAHPYPKEAETTQGYTNCTIEPKDGIKIPEGPPRNIYNGSFSDVLCGYEGLSPSVTYELRVTIVGDSTSMDIDYIEYTTDKPGAGDIIRFNHQSSSITYTENTTITNEFGLLGYYQDFNFSYYGNTATPYFYLKNNTRAGYIVASYDFSPTAQYLSLPTSGDKLKERVYFPLQVESGVAHTTGYHWLAVKYLPGSTYSSLENPIYLDFIEVQYESPPPSSSSDIPSQPTSESSDHSHDVRIIVGATIGGIVGILALALYALLWLRRRRRRNKALGVKPEPFLQEVTPNTSFISRNRTKRDEDKAPESYNDISSSGRAGWADQQIQALRSFGSGRNPEPDDPSELSSQPRVIQVIHADSGMTLPVARQGVIIEDIPPEYTARVVTE